MARVRTVAKIRGGEKVQVSSIVDFDGDVRDIELFELDGDDISEQWDDLSSEDKEAIYAALWEKYGEEGHLGVEG